MWILNTTLNLQYLTFIKDTFKECLDKETKIERYFKYINLSIFIFRKYI